MALNNRSFFCLGTVQLTNLPQSLRVIFPLLNDSNVCAVSIQTHEDNDPNTYVYIGDRTMTALPNTAGYVLMGKRDRFFVANENSQNSLDPEDFCLMSNPTGAFVRIFLLTS